MEASRHELLKRSQGRLMCLNLPPQSFSVLVTGQGLLDDVEVVALLIRSAQSKIRTRASLEMLRDGSSNVVIPALNQCLHC